MVTRLGENLYKKNCINAKAMQRTIKICKNFLSEARKEGTHHIFAFATSAVREASNKKVFLKKLFQATGITLKVLSGKEEALCIFNALKYDIPQNRKQNTLFIEIGGGSTELAVALPRSEKCSVAEELKIGALKLSEMFCEKKAMKAIPVSQYEKMKSFCSKECQNLLNKIRKYKPAFAIGSSGTIRNICAIAGVKKSISLSAIKNIAREIISKNLEERILIPGIEADRADILPAGAAILETILEETDIKKITLSYRSLRDGLLYKAAESLKDV
jgi:exopolyphosphatase/guanosine-5'-triphosphate,3'-diphosphate pyrophosphatase